MKLNIPIEKLLEITAQSLDKLRHGAVQKSSNATRIMEFYNKYPEKSVKEIAKHLRVSENAERRQLKIYFERKEQE